MKKNKKHVALSKDRLKISFCVINMNRLYHLRETLLKNIADALEYPDSEIILLDYNSSDEMEQWSREHLSDYINDNKLIYYKTFEPKIYSHSHSKNLAFKLAGGDLVCNINADNYIGEGFADYVNQAFREMPASFLVGDNVLIREQFRGTAGKVCLFRDDFMHVGGFDERMTVYGWEDTDFTNRLQYAGLQKREFSDLKYLVAIEHSNEERYNMDQQLADIHALYVDYRNFAVMKLMVLYKDGTYKAGTVNDNSKLLKKANHRYDLVGEWERGSWKSSADTIVVTASAGAGRNLQVGNADGERILTEEGNDLLLCHITDPAMMKMVVEFMLEHSNRSVMKDNRGKRRIRVNNRVFGKAEVFRNFDYATPIRV
jgi:glycosyltransferase involved in cell wall biosynthesis